MKKTQKSAQTAGNGSRRLVRSSASARAKAAASTAAAEMALAVATNPRGCAPKSR